MAIEKKSLITSTPAKSTASKLAATKNVNDKMNADGMRAAARHPVKLAKKSAVLAKRFE